MVPNTIIAANLLMMAFSFSDIGFIEQYKFVGFIISIVSIFLAVKYKVDRTTEKFEDFKKSQAKEISRVEAEINKKVDRIIFNEIRKDIDELKSDMKMLIAGKINKS